jgi:hypothetical protein
MNAPELEAIPTAQGALVARKRDEAVRRLGASQRLLDELAERARDGALDADDVDAAIDARYDAHGIAGEWIATWRTP